MDTELLNTDNHYTKFPHLNVYYFGELCDPALTAGQSTNETRNLLQRKNNKRILETSKAPSGTVNSKYIAKKCSGSICQGSLPWSLYKRFEDSGKENSGKENSSKENSSNSETEGRGSSDESQPNKRSDTNNKSGNKSSDGSYSSGNTSSDSSGGSSSNTSNNSSSNNPSNSSSKSSSSDLIYKTNNSRDFSSK